MSKADLSNTSNRKAYIITGPTSGIGRATALELAKHNIVVLVGRNPQKLTKIQKTIEQNGQRAVTVICDLSDIASVRHAVTEIIALNLSIAGLVNSAGIWQTKATKNALGWDMTFATNYLGPFALTEGLIPHLPDGAHIVFVASGTEDPDRDFSKRFHNPGARYISVEASARGEWKAYGSKRAGMDAYSTSKQCDLAATMVLARENPRLYINAVEPGLVPKTNLFREYDPFTRFLTAHILPPLAHFLKHWNTPKGAGRLIAAIVTSNLAKTGVYYDDENIPMQPSVLVRDPVFISKVVTETRALLSKVTV